jgi:hypothetical protein
VLAAKTTEVFETVAGNWLNDESVAPAAKLSEGIDNSVDRPPTPLLRLAPSAALAVSWALKVTCERKLMFAGDEPLFVRLSEFNVSETVSCSDTCVSVPETPKWPKSSNVSARRLTSGGWSGMVTVSVTVFARAFETNSTENIAASKAIPIRNFTFLSRPV